LKVTKKRKQKGTPEPLAEVEAFGRRERSEAERERAAEIPSRARDLKCKEVIEGYKKKSKRALPNLWPKFFRSALLRATSSGL